MAPDTVTASTSPRLLRRRAASAWAVAGPGSARSLRVTASSPWPRPSASTAARCSADCRRQPSSAATTTSTAVTGPTPASMLPDEPLVPRHVDDGEGPPRRQRGPRVAEVDRHPPSPLLGPAVRLLPGEGAHEGRLAVVDVAGGGEDVHPVLLPGGGCGHGVAEPLVVRLGHAAQVDQRPAALDPADDHRSPSRSAAASASGRATAQPGRVSPGAPPPPTAPSLGRPPRPARPRRGDGRGTPYGGAAPRRPRAAQRGWGWPAPQGRLHRGEGELVDAQGAGERVAAQPLDHLGGAEEQPACGPPRSLSPLPVTTEAPASSALVASGSSGSSGSACSSPDPTSTTTGTPRVARVADPHGGGEALDAEVARVHLEDAAGVRADGSGVVVQRGAVRRAHLAQPGAGRGDEVGQPEAVAYLDHLAAADDDLAARGQRRRGEDEGGGPVC